MKLCGIVGWKNSGKTGLVERLVAHFAGQGLRVATLKHAHHAFDVDQRGSDSFRHRQAGAGQVLIASDRRWALMTEHRDAEPPSLQELLTQLAPADLVLVEGWKREPITKIEAHRAGGSDPLLALSDPMVKAVASDSNPEAPCPVLPLDDTAAIAAFIAREVGL